MESVKTLAWPFYHENGMVPAYNLAKEFAGESGRIATMLDIVDARLATEPGKVPWEMYFTTMSAEYCGYRIEEKEVLSKMVVLGLHYYCYFNTHRFP